LPIRKDSLNLRKENLYEGLGEISGRAQASASTSGTEGRFTNNF
jgi:hypothetical protein